MKRKMITSSYFEEKNEQIIKYNKFEDETEKQECEQGEFVGVGEFILILKKINVVEICGKYVRHHDLWKNKEKFNNKSTQKGKKISSIPSRVLGSRVERRSKGVKHSQHTRHDDEEEGERRSTKEPRITRTTIFIMRFLYLVP